MDLIYVANWDEGVKVLRFTGHEGGWPNPPRKPTGPSEGETHIDYMFSTNTTDPEEDDVSYGWDWNGDYVVDEWTDYYPSGYEIDKMHNWSETGEYQIRVKAKDTDDHISDWSASSTITIYPASEPELIIDSIEGGLGVSFVVKNIGTANATDVHWEMDIQDGLFISSRDFEDTIFGEIPPSEILNASVNLFGIGLGLLTEIPTIIIRVNASNADMVEESIMGKILGPFVFLQ
jgi:hypothetical protein